MTCLGDPNTFILDHLLTLKPVKFLEGELIHDVSEEVVCSSVMRGVNVTVVIQTFHCASFIIFLLCGCGKIVITAQKLGIVS